MLRLPIAVGYRPAPAVCRRFVARKIVTQPPDLPLLLFDDNVPRIPLRRSLLQNGAYATQQAHAVVVSAPSTKTYIPSREFFPGSGKQRLRALFQSPRSWAIASGL